MHHYRAFTQFAALLSPIEAERKRNAWTMASTVESCNCKKRMEARVGIEPTYKGFADLSLTTWVPRQSRSYCVLLLGHLHSRRTYSKVRSMSDISQLIKRNRLPRKQRGERIETK